MLCCGKRKVSMGGGDVCICAYVFDFMYGCVGVCMCVLCVCVCMPKPMLMPMTLIACARLFVNLFSFSAASLSLLRRQLLILSWSRLCHFLSHFMRRFKWDCEWWMCKMKRRRLKSNGITVFFFSRSNTFSAFKALISIQMLNKMW